MSPVIIDSLTPAWWNDGDGRVGVLPACPVVNACCMRRVRAAVAAPKRLTRWGRSWGVQAIGKLQM